MKQFIYLISIILICYYQCSCCPCVAADANVNDANSDIDATGADINEDGNNQSCDNPDTNTCSATAAAAAAAAMKQQKQEQEQHSYKFPGCRLFLAPSTLNTSNESIDVGYGIFTTRSLKRGQPITFPDIVINVNDYYQPDDNSNASNNNKNIGQLIDQYSWDANKFGAQNEGTKIIASILPGIGSIANAQTSFQTANAIPYRPDIDEANVPRTTHHNAGGFTHYHNLTFFASTIINAGDEIFVHYDIKRNDEPWFRPRVKGTKTFIENTDTNTNTNDKKKSRSRSVQWLEQNGICLDNIQPGYSKVKGAGRGAFATRFIPKGSVIAPLPMVVIPDRKSLSLPKRNTNNKKKNKKKDEEQMQLLLNYCFGHTNSSVLFYPTSPIVNLINHAPTTIPDANLATSTTTTTSSNSKTSKEDAAKTPKTANAKLQWSRTTATTNKDSHMNNNNNINISLERLKEHSSTYKSSNLNMEFIATRDIQPKEEIFFDYGPTWTNAFNDHSQSWKPISGTQPYAPSYVMEDVAGLIRSAEEQLKHPYAPNLEISCFYQYSIYKDKRNDGIMSSSYSSKNTVSSGEVTTVKWQMDRRTFEFKNLRPCQIIERVKLEKNPGRDGGGRQEQWSYTVMMKNRPGLSKEETIPKGIMHVVNMVPRGAMRFTDKIYSTDQHLPNAFRHEIGMPDDIFPNAWMDL